MPGSRARARAGVTSTGRREAGRARGRGRARLRGPAADLGLRRRPRQSRARATFDAVLEAAADIVTRQGYAAMTTNAVARRAGVSIGSLYQYFPDRSAILVCLLERHLREIQPLIAAGLATLADPRTPLADGLRRLFARLVDSHAHNPRLAEALAEEVPHPPAIRRLHHELEGGYVTQVAEVLRRRPDVRVDRPEVAAQVTIVVADAVTRWLAHSAPRSLDRALYVDEVVRLLGSYLGRDRP